MTFGVGLGFYHARRAERESLSKIETLQRSIRYRIANVGMSEWKGLGVRFETVVVEGRSGREKGFLKAMESRGACH
jgi:hypothetical protein